MADIDVAEIERLLEACTTAPWTLNEEPERTYPGGDIDRGGWRIDAPGVEQLAFFWRDAQRWGPNPEPFGAKEAEANARLTAAAPAAIRSLLSRTRALEAALTPSAETKGAYIGEFTFRMVYTDGHGDEYSETVTVPWPTIKAIMAAILARAAMKEGKGHG